MSPIQIYAALMRHAGLSLEFIFHNTYLGRSRRRTSRPAAGDWSLGQNGRSESSAALSSIAFRLLPGDNSTALSFFAQEAMVVSP